MRLLRRMSAIYDASTDSSSGCSRRAPVSQINAGRKAASIRVQAWHESQAGVLNLEVSSTASKTVILTPVSYSVHVETSRYRYNA